MKPNALLISVVFAALLGIGHHYFIVWCWGYIAQYSPLVGWLVGIGLRESALRAALFPLDFVTSVVVSLPAAYLLRMLRPGLLWLYLIVAIFPTFVWFNLRVLGNEFEPVFLFGWASELFALPVAAWLLRFPLRPPTESVSVAPARDAA